MQVIGSYLCWLLCWSDSAALCGGTCRTDFRFDVDGLAVWGSEGAVQERRPERRIGGLRGVGGPWLA